MVGRSAAWLLRSLGIVSLVLGVGLVVVNPSRPSQRPHFDVETTEVLRRLLTGAKDPTPTDMKFVEGTIPVLPPVILED